jgi:U3 small nucleolar RNA-associated protein 14
MPPRIARQSLPVSKPKAAKSGSRKRALDAFTIASAEAPEKQRIRPNRLGESDDGPQRKKRRVPSDDNSDNEDTSTAHKRHKGNSSKDVDVSDESDSEGNTWRVGHVDEDDDSDIDSDEAFDSEDEERFAHYSFGASKQTKARTAENGMDLQEEEEDEDSFGEDAVDLAQMLDEYPEDSEKEASSNQEQASASSDESDDAFSNSSFSDEEGVDDDQMAKLQSLVSSLHPETESKKTSNIYNSKVPTAAGPTTSEKFDIRDLFNNSDPQLAKMSKKLGNLPKQPKKDPKLAPSLPKRQKDKLERVAANEKTKQTLDRWVDSVKHMRQAEHVQFPLQDPESARAQGAEHLLPAITTKPLNALESTVNSILQDSGLVPAEDNESGDELPENGVTVQEVLARRAELRRARELIFREEQKSKRIKKIKSKSYRRVHRKERERLAQLEDSDMDDEEREAHDRRRAEERMGAKHKDSKWAKQMKKSGRTIWDDEARSGVVEMARRNDELRQRIGGKMDGDETSGSNDDAPSDEDDGTAQDRRMRNSLDKLEHEAGPDPKSSKLGSMKFMLKAEESLKAQNKREMARIRREMDGIASSDDSSNENVGRKLFGPSEKSRSREENQQRTEFEELEFSEDDIEEETGPVVDPTASTMLKSNGLTIPQAQSLTPPLASKTKTNNSKPKASEREILSKPDAEGWITVTYDHDSDSSKDDEDDQESLPDQAALISKVFAGDDVEIEFEKEKQTVVDDENEKIIDNTMAGWGSWVGEGLSKREQNRAKGKVLTKQDGIKPENRKDAKLKHVIINEKRVRKNAGYLASALPFPFTNRAEYEKSIRMPIGTEWNVKKSYQENTKPRVLVKPGSIVKPMEKPLV